MSVLPCLFISILPPTGGCIVLFSFFSFFSLSSHLACLWVTWGAFVGGPAVEFCCAVQYTAQRMRREVDSPVRPLEIQGKGREQPRDSKRRAFPQTPSTSLPSSFPRKKEERKRNFSAVVEVNYKSGGPSVPGKGIGGWGKCFFFAAPSCKEDIWQRKKRKTYPGKRLGVTSERTPYPPFPRGSLFDMQHHIIRRHPPFPPT